MEPSLDPLTTLARAILGLGAGIVVPLGLAAGGPREGEAGRPLHAFARKLASPAAVGLMVSLVTTDPTLASLACTPWLALSALVALVGLRRLFARLRSPARADLGELALDAGYVYLPVGAAWAFVYRSDASLFGFTGMQALLTANHFHYAGFGACVLVGIVGRRLGPGAGLTYRAAAVLTTAAVALVAAGITLSHALEVFAAWALVLGVALTAASLVRVARVASGVVRALFAISALSGLVAAGFAAHFATGGFAHLDAVALRRMLFFHALVNALGFVGAGLTACLLAARSSPPPGDQGRKALSSSPETTTT
ncbi:MAG: YndJ family transporter [Myxococcales bacterium]|nr:YndJ family transporter [Myxococcales bacterium]